MAGRGLALPAEGGGLNVCVVGVSVGTCKLQKWSFPRIAQMLYE
jgi:hypothetical protein